MAGASAQIGRLIAPELVEAYAYTQGGLVTHKGYTVNENRQVSVNPYATAFVTFGPSMNYSWNTEGHHIGYGSFVYGLDQMGRKHG